MLYVLDLKLKLKAVGASLVGLWFGIMHLVLLSLQINILSKEINLWYNLAVSTLLFYILCHILRKINK